MCRNKNRKGGGVKIVILSWDKPKKYGISKKHSKQAIGQVKKNYKMFANPVFITPGRYIRILHLRHPNAVSSYISAAACCKFMWLFCLQHNSSAVFFL